MKLNILTLAFLFLFTIISNAQTIPINLAKEHINNENPIIIPKVVMPPDNPDLRIYPSDADQYDISITISPIDDQIIFVSADASNGTGYYYSTNGGVNWRGLNTVDRYDLSQNYPNPFNPSTTIKFQIPKNGFVSLKVYDILGNEISTLINEQKAQGRYEVNFNASSLASGVYVYKIQAGGFISSKKMMLLK